MYHNTTDLEGAELKDSQVKAETQTEKVLWVFECFPGRVMTPFEVMHDGQFDCPITSIRRAISDLTKEGKLVKTESKREGDYGKPNYMWTLNIQKGQIPLF